MVSRSTHVKRPVLWELSIWFSWEFNLMKAVFVLKDSAICWHVICLYEFNPKNFHVSWKILKIMYIFILLHRTCSSFNGWLDSACTVSTVWMKMKKLFRKLWIVKQLIESLYKYLMNTYFIQDVMLTGSSEGVSGYRWKTWNEGGRLRVGDWRRNRWFQSRKVARDSVLLWKRLLKLCLVICLRFS